MQLKYTFSKKQNIITQMLFSFTFKCKTALKISLERGVTFPISQIYNHAEMRFEILEISSPQEISLLQS